MKIIIVGGIAAGMSAAAKARRVNRDAEVIVYEMEDIISFGACGLPYYIGDFFKNEKRMIARTVEQMQDAGVNVQVRHQVLSVDPKLKSLSVKNLNTEEVFEQTYDKLMIATGATVIQPPFSNMQIDNIFKLTKMQDGLRLKEKLVSEDIQNITIIGAGFIGVEVVEAMIHLGKSVRLIQRSSRVFNGIFDEKITDLMQEELLSKGVEVILNESVSSFVGTDKVQAVVTDKQTYKTDLVVVATGFKPNTDFIIDTGIETLNNGAIIVNKKGETSIKDIYSAGDCATVPHMLTHENVYIPLATGANKLGRVVGVNIAGGDAEYMGSLGSACVKVMDYEAATTGLSQPKPQDMQTKYSTVFIKDKNFTGYYPNQEDLYIKLVYETQSKIIVGGQTLGKNGAALRINVIAMAIKMKMTTSELGMMDFCYSPPISKTWDALNVVGNVAK
ncbi:MAG: CoA-disulfide reductase [Sulfurimonas sp.]|nr:CoA-disulfide reductase [Sulfurimonas sp.]